MNEFKNKSFDCFKFSKNQEYYWIFGFHSAQTILFDVINNYLVSVEDLLNCYDADFSELKNLLEESIFFETNKYLTVEQKCNNQKKFTNSKTNYFCCTPIAE